MDDLRLKQLISEGFSLRGIAKEEKCSQGSVRYWLRKYGLKTRRGPKGKFVKDLLTPRQCKCGETDPHKFYGNKRKVCARCHNRYNHQKGKDKRQKAVELMGGACKACGFSRWTSSLAIHHLDPEKKDASFKTFRSWSWKRITKEIEGCILLCHNCHTAHHSGEDIWV